MNSEPSSDDDPGRLILQPGEFKAEATKLTRKLLRAITATEHSGSRKTMAAFRSALKTMYEGEEVEVTSSEYRDRTLFFKKAQALPTLTALKLQTEEIMTDRSYHWDRIACTPESGQWLVRHERYLTEIKRRKAGIAMVVADQAFDAKLNDMYGHHLVAPIRWLPWWLHNRHVTLFLNGPQPKFAISFERRLRTARIAPLFLSSPDDLQEAWDFFAAYWLRAEWLRLERSADENAERKHHDGIVRIEDLARAKREILKTYSSPRR